MRTSFNTRIKFSDKNNQSEFRFGSMIDMMQDCMNHQSESIDLGVAYQLRTGHAWILRSWQIEIRGSFAYDEEVVVSTWPYEFWGACGKRNAMIARATSENDGVIVADSVWAMVDVNQGRLIKPTDEDIQAYGVEERLDMGYKKGKIVRGRNYEKKDSFVVRKYQLDFNNHMNNGWYVKIAEEFVENNETVKSLRVEYKKSAMYGDSVIAYVADEKDRMVVELRDTEDEVYSIIEFLYE